MSTTINSRRRRSPAESENTKDVPAFQRSATATTPSTFTPPTLDRKPQSSLEDLMADALDSFANLDLSPASPNTRSSTDDNSIKSPSLFKKPAVDPSEAHDSLCTKRTRRDSQRQRRRSSSADSAIGSESDSDNTKTESSSTATSSSSNSSNSNSNSNSNSSSKAASPPMVAGRLSPRAEMRIVQFIVKPLLTKPSLKDFHPILQEVPRRISSSTITCLRDLEKTLIFMAPERAKTARLYLDFCLSSVACIKRTVELIPERERTRPSERLYTNAYFSDLTEQIRQYAAHLAVSKAQIAAGSDSSLLAHPTDEIKLYGGLSQNGRPAQLVRVTKDGKTISVETGELLEDENGPVIMDAPLRMKRSLSEQLADDEEIMRSMARRKKNPTPEELAPKKCLHPGCNKEFKRPCDLTKHSKTHLRRWKCPEIDCKYHTYGWPTEKERDRHINDRHSSAPALYKCQFHPCPYSSKRESNCKQHMEKTHGWVYVRTKSNGKKGPDTPSMPVATSPGGPAGMMMNSPNSAQQTPHLQNISTPSSAESTGIATPPTETLPQFPLENSLEFPTYVPQEFLASYNPQYINAMDGMDETILEMGLDLPPSTNIPELGATPSSLESPGEASVDAADFALTDDIYAAAMQMNTDHFDYASLLNQQLLAAHQPTLEQLQSGGMHNQKMLPQTFDLISPMSQAEAMLYTPSSIGTDNSYDDLHSMMGMDFPLYPGSAPANSKEMIPESLFDGLNMPGYTCSSHHVSQSLFEGQMDWSSQGAFFDGQQHQ